MFIMKMAQKYRFCTVIFSENTRKAIKEFYKTIHPDLFEKAPSKVKEENERSLKQLNNYLDCLKKNHGSTSIPLKFYAANKTNNKSKKFLFFEVELPGFLPNSASDTLKLHEMDMIKKLNNSLFSTQLKNNPFGLENAKKQDENEEVELDHAYPDLFVKSTSKREAIKEVSDLRNQFNKSIFETTNKKIKDDLVKSLQVIYPFMQSVELVTSEIINDLQAQQLQAKMLEAKIDPKIFFVDKNLDPIKIMRFFFELCDNLSLNLIDHKNYQKIQNYFQSNDQKIKIRVSSENKVFAGFVSIDYRLPIGEVIAFIRQSAGLAMEAREVMFEKSNDPLEELKNLIQKDYQVKLINIEYDFGNGNVETVLNKKSLFMKKLLRVFNKFQSSTFAVHLSNVRVNLVEKGVNVGENKTEWDLCWNFDDQKLFWLLSKKMAL